MYYLRQHQFSQLAVFTVQILSCLWARPWFSTSGCEAPLYCGGVLQGTMHNKQVAGFTVATSSLPVKLYPWDCSKFTVSPSHGDACRCVKPNQQEEKKRKNCSLEPH